jgi:hypothetical protein
MDAASGSQPARDGRAPALARGMIFAPLNESRPGRIIVGDRVLFLRNGTTCTYVVGTPLEVTFTQENGRSLVDKITPIRAR